MKKISAILWENKKLLNDELKCFIEIEHYIIYIMSSNCKNHSFGYLNCTIFLLNMFKNLINSKFEYLLTNRNLDKYKSNLEEYPKKLYSEKLHINVSVDVIGFKPISLKELLKKVEEKNNSGGKL